jgi:rhodanese-related sulfurtransferase
MNIAVILLLSFIFIGIGYIVYLKLFLHNSNKVKVLDVEEFEAVLAANKDVLLVDVRTAREFKKYRIDGAINFDYLSINFRKEIKKLDKTKTVMVYCHSGYRSKMTMPIFCKVGFKTLYELDDGFMSWLKAKKPIITKNR